MATRKIEEMKLVKWETISKMSIWGKVSYRRTLHVHDCMHYACVLLFCLSLIERVIADFMSLRVQSLLCRVVEWDIEMLGRKRKVCDFMITVLTINYEIRLYRASFSGQLGYGDTEDRGNEDGEMGDNLPLVDLGDGFNVSALSIDNFFATYQCAADQVEFLPSA